jgi:cyclomaltodextrinase / maltogenic alpha-amylase / neopullulanase
MIKLGKYKHYKGQEYEVIGVAKHSETLEYMVVYRALYGENQIWVRPLKMFIEEVEVDGKKAPRFEYLG